MALVILGLFAVADTFSFPWEVAKKILFVRVGIIMPLFVYAYYTSYRLLRGESFHSVLVLTGLVTAFGAVIIVYIPYAAGIDAHYEGLMLFMFGLGGFMGMRFRYASGVLLLMVVFYVLTLMTTDSSTEFIVDLPSVCFLPA